MKEELLPNKQTRVYSDRNERSTNSKGRSTRIDNSPQKRQISRRESPVRSPQQRTSNE